MRPLPSLIGTFMKSVTKYMVVFEGQSPISNLEDDTIDRLPDTEEQATSKAEELIKFAGEVELPAYEIYEIQINMKAIKKKAVA
jgi:hypothetical protein